MSIVKISNNAIAEILPLNTPIDDTWRYIHDVAPVYDPQYQTFTYDFSYDANTDQVTSTANVSYIDLDTIKQIKIDNLADYRWNIETGGTVVGGMSIATDENSQSKITGARVAADANSQLTIDWKAENAWVTINAAIIIVISDAVREHVQLCFTNEKNHTNAINALTDANSAVNYDFTTGWPT